MESFSEIGLRQLWVIVMCKSIVTLIKVQAACYCIDSSVPDPDPLMQLGQRIRIQEG